MAVGKASFFQSNPEAGRFYGLSPVDTFAPVRLEAR